MRLLIAIPTLDYVHSEFMRSLVNLTIRLKNEGINFDVEIISGTLVYSAREKLAKKAVNEKYSHVLWLDSDMVFTDDLLEDLMFSGEAFVSGIYHTRRPPHNSCIFKDISLDNIQRYDKGDYPSNTFEIAGCGFGCVLLETCILEEVLLKYETCFLPLPSLGEDIAFCKRVHGIGQKMYCEPGVRLGHIGHITIYPEAYEQWKAINKIEV